MNTSPFPIKIFVEWVENTYQLHFGSHNQVQLIRIVETRCRELFLESPHYYLSLLAKDSKENEWFLSQITIGESSFFRYPKLFLALEKKILPALIKKSKIHILHIGCSGGQEPYSVSILLDMLGITSAQVEISAIDIDSFAIAKAQKGIYRRHSLAQVPLPILQKYFYQLSDHEWQCDKKIRDFVDFRTMNVFKLEGTALLKKYDLIFCMNVMIYFQSKTINNLLKVLCEISDSSTQIFISPTDVILQMNEHFESCRQYDIMWYKKKSIGTQEKITLSDKNELYKHIDIEQHHRAPIEEVKKIAKKCSYYKEGQHFYAIKNFYSALDIFFKGIDKNPRCALCYFGIAQIYADQEKIFLAITYLKLSLQHEENNYQALLLMGILHLHTDDLQTAKQYLLDALQVNPGSREAQHFLDIVQS